MSIFSSGVSGGDVDSLLNADGLEAGLLRNTGSRGSRSRRWMFVALASSLALGLLCYHLAPLTQERKESDSSTVLVLSSKVSLFQTAESTGDRHSSLPALSPVEDLGFLGTVINVDPAVRDQTILGFGGAFTEAAALQFKGLKAELQQEVLEMYFGDSGLGYSTGRIPINSCDFSPNHYTFDDVAGDVNLTHFDHEVKHDKVAMIPFITAAQNKTREHGRPLHLFASPWSAPAWMKANGKMPGSTQPGLRPEFRATWAKYLSQWIAAYKAQGIPIWGMTVQNEPEYSAPWEAMRFNSHQEADFLGQYLGPLMRKDHPEVKIFGYDHGKPHLPIWANTLYNSAAREYLTGIAFHWYEGDHFEEVRKVHHAFPQAMLLPSEATYTHDKWGTDWKTKTGKWALGEGYAHDIMGDLKAGAVGWTDWNLLLDTSGGPNWHGNYCDAPIFVDVAKQQLYVHPQFYYIGHFSKYILPGSVRISSHVEKTLRYVGQGRPYGTCTAMDGLDVVSFLRPDNKIATVVLSCADWTVDFKLKFQGNSRVIRASIPPHAIQTYLIESSDDEQQKITQQSRP